MSWNHVVGMMSATVVTVALTADALTSGGDDGRTEARVAVAVGVSTVVSYSLGAIFGHVEGYADRWGHAECSGRVHYPRDRFPDGPVGPAGHQGPTAFDMEDAE